MKSDIKKLLQEGVAVEVLSYQWNEGQDSIHKYKNISRKIEKRQTNAIRFEGGSRLYFWPASESEWVDKENKIFRVWSVNQIGNKVGILTYKID